MKHQRLIASFLSILIVLSIVCATARAQGQAFEPSVEDMRLARLTGLARVWGAVKYFHPYLAYRDIDWDKALIDTIPKVNAARTGEEYRAAISQMLSVLNDPVTRVESQTEKQVSGSDGPAATNTAKPVRRQGRVLIIDALQIAKTLAQDVGAVRGFMDDINEGLKNASAIVVDTRGTREPEEFESYRFDRFLRQALPTLLYTTVVLGSSRYRMHNGYATQVGAGSDFYYSALVSTAPQTIVGRSRIKTPPPMAFIFNRYSPDFTEIMSGMQSGTGAFLIREGDEKPDSATINIDLPDNLKVSMRTAELVNANGSIGLQVDSAVPKRTTDDTAMKEALRVVQQNRVGPTRARTTQPYASQISQKDNPYSEMKFPTREYRLLALFRFWNVINYFYPYRKLIDDTWQTVLPRFIPKFEANKDAGDYQLTVLELVTEMHDSHGGVQNADAMLERLGAFLPPVLTSYVENQSVVTKVLGKLPINTGDVILSVDDEPVEKRREFLARYAPASTPQWRMVGVHEALLTGPKNTMVKLRVRGPDGGTRDVELPRSVSIMEPQMYEAGLSSPTVYVLPSGYGYVNLKRLQVGEVDKMFETIKDTPAVIFDMRGYPNGTAWSIAPRLTEKKDVVAALFSRPLLEAINLQSIDDADPPTYSFAQKLPEAKGPVYKGKVVMLINGEAISQAEHTCLFFEAATDVTFVGTPTAGANGDVTFMVLPGNLAVSFTGHNVRHADGRQLQRVGIQPTIRVEPTIRGIVAGRDETLEAAVKYLQDTLKK